MYRLKKHQDNIVEKGFESKRGKSRISAWIYDSQVDQLDEEADRYGISRNELLRRILRQYFEYREGDRDE